MWSGFYFLGFFNPQFIKVLTTTAKEILQWYSSTYSYNTYWEYSLEDYMCVPWLLGPDCCRSVVGRKTQWLCYQARYERAQDLMGSCWWKNHQWAREKKKNRSHTGLVIELKTEHGNNMMAHAILFKHNVKKYIVYLNTLISYMYYIPIVKGAACYFENYIFKTALIKLRHSVCVLWVHWQNSSRGFSTQSRDHVTMQGFRNKLVISVNVTPPKTHFTTSYYKEALVCACE